jgi:ABC-type uncharacterized transport system ATPase component
MTNATESVRYSAAGPHNVPVNKNVKDIKAQGTGTITYTDNSGNSTVADVTSGELLMMRGDITVTASDVDYIVYT